VAVGFAIGRSLREPRPIDLWDQSSVPRPKLLGAAARA
jgi:hypothetical protein